MSNQKIIDNTLRNEFSAQRRWPTNCKREASFNITGRPIVIALPYRIMKDNASCYNDINLDHPEGIWFAIALQYWLHVVDDAKERYLSEGYTFDKIPISIFLEQLMDYDGHVFEYRLYIIEEDDAKPNLKIAEIYKTLYDPKKHRAATMGPQQNNARGPNLLGNGGNDLSLGNEVALRHAPATTRAFIGGKSNAAYTGQEDDKILGNMLYKLIKNEATLTFMESIVCRINPSRESAHFKFSLENAIKHSTYSPDSGKGVKLSQRTYSNYVTAPLAGPSGIISTASLLRLTLNAADGIFQVDMYSWRISRFLLRQFPHLQFNKIDLAFEKMIKEIAASVDNKIKIAKLGVDGTTGDRNKTSKMGLMNKLGRGHSKGDESATEASAEQQADVGGVFVPDRGNIRCFSNEQLCEIQRTMDFASQIKDDDEADKRKNLKIHGIQDQMDAFAAMYGDYCKVIENEYYFDVHIVLQRFKGNRSDGDFKVIEETLRYEMNKRKNFLEEYIIEQFNLFAFNSPFNISDTFGCAMTEAKKNRLFEMLERGEFELFCSDPTLTPGENWWIRSMQRFQKLELIPFQPGIATELLIDSSKCWNTKKPNSKRMLVGNMSTSKTFVMNCIKENTCKMAWEEINSESRRSGNNGERNIHALKYNDDASLISSVQSKDNKDGEQRALDSNGMLVHKTTVMEPTRHIETIVSIWRGWSVESSNVGFAQLMSLGGHAKRAQTEATLSRITFTNFNTKTDDYYSLLGANSSDNMSPDLKRDRDHARKENQLLWLMTGFVHEMMEVMPNKVPSMDAFEISLQEVVAYMKMSGFTEPIIRLINTIKDFACEWTIRRTLIDNYFIRTGKYFKTAFHSSQLLYIPFICTESDFVLSFTTFAHLFYSQEVSTIIDVILKKLENAHLARDNTVIFMNPYYTEGDGEEEKPVKKITGNEDDDLEAQGVFTHKDKKFKGGEDYMDEMGMNEEDEKTKLRDRQRNAEDFLADLGMSPAEKPSKPIGSGKFMKFGVFGNSRPTEKTVNRENEKSPMGYNSQQRRDIEEGAEEGGEEEEEEDDNDKKKNKKNNAKKYFEGKRTISYVCLNNMNKFELTREIVRATYDMPDRPSLPQIEYDLSFLAELQILTPQWTVSAKKKKSRKEGMDTTAWLPVLSPDSVAVKRSGVIFGKHQCYINYELLQHTRKFNSFWKECIQSIFFKHTIARRMMTCIPNEKFHWLMDVIEAKPTSRERLFPNPRYIGPDHQIILTGKRNPQALEEAQTMRMLKMNQDTDTTCIIKHISRMNLTCEGDTEAMMQFHPVRITALWKGKILDLALNEEGYQDIRFISYPESLETLYKEIKDDRKKYRDGEFSEVNGIGNIEVLLRYESLRDSEEVMVKRKKEFDMLSEVVSMKIDLESFFDGRTTQDSKIKHILDVAERQKNTHIPRSKALDNCLYSSVEVEDVTQDDDALNNLMGMRALLEETEEGAGGMAEAPFSFEAFDVNMDPEEEQALHRRLMSNLTQINNSLRNLDDDLSDNESEFRSDNGEGDKEEDFDDDDDDDDDGEGEYEDEEEEDD